MWTLTPGEVNAHVIGLVHRYKAIVLPKDLNGIAA